MCFLFLPTSLIHIIKSFSITNNIKWCCCWYCWWWGLSLVLSWSWIDTVLIYSHPPNNRNWSKITVLCTTAIVWELLPFTWLLNVLLLEKKLLEVMLIWWFVSIRVIRFFSKILFFNDFLYKVLLVISSSLKKLSLFNLHISLW